MFHYSFLILLFFYFSEFHTCAEYIQLKLFQKNKNKNIKQYSSNSQGNNLDKYADHTHIKIENRKMIQISCYNTENKCDGKIHSDTKDNKKDVNHINHSKSHDFREIEIGENSIEYLLQNLKHFEIMTDKVLGPILIPPTPFNSSLSHSLRLVN